MTTDHTPPTDQTAEIERLRTENERMRHELKVMYGGAFDTPPADQTALRDRIAAAMYGAEYPGFEWAEAHDEDREQALQRADAVVAVLPPPADRAAILREAADAGEDVANRIHASGDDHRAGGAYDVVDELRRVADETQPAEALPEENPARIDRLRPEFFEHASVESIDVQIRRAQRQQCHWGNRERTLAILRQARVKQKESGEWPAAGARQDGAQP